MIFTINNDNGIEAHTEAPAAVEGTLAFSSKQELADATAGWPMLRLEEIWNGFAGVAPFVNLKPIKKFENRGAAIRRIWNAIQLATPDPEPKPAKKASKKSPKPAQAPEAAKKAAATAEPKKGHEDRYHRAAAQSATLKPSW